MIYYDIIMKNEIIQIVTCDNYDGFQHLNFVFSQKNVYFFKKLFKDETNPRVKFHTSLLVIPFEKVYSPY
jgi:hypothetical protein